MNKLSTIQSLLRQIYINRWHICEMHRPQSLAEHSYAVWALATDLWLHMWPTNHNTMEFRDMQQYCMVHDLEEIETGDCPSTFKAEIEKLAPGVIKRAQDVVLARLDLGPLQMANVVRGSVVEPIVEIADLTEAMLYFAKYGVDDPAIMVSAFQIQKMNRMLEAAQSAFPQYDWQCAGEWVEAQVRPPKPMARHVFTMPRETKL